MSEFVKAAQNGDLNEVKRLFALNPAIINERIESTIQQL